MKQMRSNELINRVLLILGAYSFAMLVYGYLSGYGTMIGIINMISSLITGLIYTWMLKRSKYYAANNPTTLDSYKVLGIGVTVIVLCFIIW